MRAATEFFQVVVADNRVTESLLHAMRNHRLEFWNARFNQPNLSDRSRPFRERREARVQSVQALLAWRSVGSGFDVPRRPAFAFACALVARRRWRTTIG